MYITRLTRSWRGLQGKSPEAVRAAAYFTSWTLSSPRRSRSWIQASCAQANVALSSPLHPDMMSPVLTLTCRRSPSQPTLPTAILHRDVAALILLQAVNYSAAAAAESIRARVHVVRAYTSLFVLPLPSLLWPLCVCVADEKWKRQRKADGEVTRRLYFIASLTICHVRKEKNIIPLPGSFFPSSHQELEKQIWTSSGPR